MKRWQWILLAGALAVAVSSTAPAREEPELPPAPSPEDIDLLKVASFDRLILVDGDVVECEPIEPRPLGRPAPGKEITIRLLSGKRRDFKVLRQNIREIQYFEDMLLAKGDALLAENAFRQAFQYYQAAMRLSPEWSGLRERFEKLLLTESDFHVVRGNPDRALQLLHELKTYSPDYPGISERIVDMLDNLIRDAFENHRYASGRRYLRNLRKNSPDHALLTKWETHYVETAMFYTSDALQKEKVGEFSQAYRLAQQGVTIWPNTD